MDFYAFDASYLEKLRDGDTRTEEHFASYFRELIQLKLRSRVNSKESIEDIQQETFVRVFSALRSEKGPSQPDRLGAYVNSVCNHVLLEHYRSEKRTDPLATDGLAERLVEPGRDAFSLLATKETGNAVHEILNRMTERDRCLLRDVLLEERDKDEVCRELGVDREYLRVLIHRAKQSFKGFLAGR
ncbi:MAG TPA: sigma-70 family RNA polymerase sigma factor [Acidobacteriaceae bacterium]|nr:sigma-70 family RNA polymerase sigma factor [Acidobacteriaceae bacterium]